MMEKEKTNDMTEQKQNETFADAQETNAEENKLKKALGQQLGAFSGPMSFDEFMALLDKLDEEKKAEK
ncbi:MAG: hypothetical protein IIX92_00600 [Selenomonadales bacterium]|nr:hypothetical protein [Selenomonadales bacterium]